ncbi:MAG: TolC family protein [Mariniblastus sp.]
MVRRFIIFALTLTFLVGCKFGGDDRARLNFSSALDLESHVDLELGPSSNPDLVPSLANLGPTESFESFDTGPLEDFNFSQAGNYRRITLEDCLQRALQDSPVVRELGGLILRAPDSVATDNDPAMAYVDPRFGEEAALSSFDTNFNSQLLFQKNDRLFNNQFLGDEGAFQQDLANYRTGISKLAATGGQFGFNHVIDYELNNSPSNRFNGTNETSFAYDVAMEAQFRQPLLQGAGTTFNRIAGPNNAPGVYNGVLIARANTDIALADFETRVRDLVSDVENAYWDLFFAYRDLEAKIEARNGAYDIWQNVEANKGEKSAAIIGQAKEQYYRFSADVEDAIHGRLNEGTKTNNGSSSGTFRRAGGVRTAERRLRLITGMKLNDSQLIVPADTPIDAASLFDWRQSRDNALSLRTELRQQRWKVKRRELELLASKNNLLPRIDLLGKYRVKGFGHDLFGDGNELIQGGTLEQQLDSSAYGTLASGNLQEWELGLDMSVPIGFRQQHAARRHAELNLAREHSILKEQERQIIFGLSNAMGELVRTTKVRTANLNRLRAANEQFGAIQNIWREQDTTIDLVLEAQRRVIEAKLQYFQTQVEYMLAIKAVHFEEGTLFAYHDITLTESKAASLAERQAFQKSRVKKRTIDYWIPGLKTSRGAAPVNQHSGGTLRTPNQIEIAAPTQIVIPNQTKLESFSLKDSTPKQHMPLKNQVVIHSSETISTPPPMVESAANFDPPRRVNLVISDSSLTRGTVAPHMPLHPIRATPLDQQQKLKNGDPQGIARQAAFESFSDSGPVQNATFTDLEN